MAWIARRATTAGSTCRGGDNWSARVTAARTRSKARHGSIRDQGSAGGSLSRFSANTAREGAREKLEFGSRVLHQAEALFDRHRLLALFRRERQAGAAPGAAGPGHAGLGVA